LLSEKKNKKWADIGVLLVGMDWTSAVAGYPALLYRYVSVIGSDIKFTVRLDIRLFQKSF